MFDRQGNVLCCKQRLYNRDFTLGRAMCCAANSDFTRQGNVLCCKQRLYKAGQCAVLQTAILQQAGQCAVLQTAVLQQGGHKAGQQDSNCIAGRAQYSATKQRQHNSNATVLYCNVKE
jgi:hypothetical protein